MRAGEGLSSEHTLLAKRLKKTSHSHYEATARSLLMCPLLGCREEGGN